MATDTTDYDDKAQENAADAVRDLSDEIADSLIENDGKASDDLLNDYGRGGEEAESGWMEESFNIQEAAKCLDDLDDYEETDSGLWEGKDMRDALETCAAFTLRNASMHYFDVLIGNVNDEIDFEEIKEAATDAWKASQRGKATIVAIDELKDDEKPAENAVEERADALLEEWAEEDEDGDIAKAIKVAVKARVEEIADEYHK